MAGYLPTAVPCFSSPQQMLTIRADLAVMLMRGAASMQKKIEKKAMEKAKAQSGGGAGGGGVKRRRLRNVSVDELKGILKPASVGEAMMPTITE